MDHTLHCRLCDHQKFSLEAGSLCGVTNRKPDFHRTCNKIRLSNTIKEKITEANVAYEMVIRRKLRIYSFFIGYMLLGIGTLVVIYIMLGYLSSLWDKLQGRALLVYAIPFVFLGICIKLFMQATEAMGVFTNDLNDANRKKNNVDKIAQLYGVSYDIDIQFEDNGLDELIPHVDLKTRGIR